MRLSLALFMGGKDSVILPQLLTTLCANLSETSPAIGSRMHSFDEMMEMAHFASCKSSCNRAEITCSILFAGVAGPGGGCRLCPTCRQHLSTSLSRLWPIIGVTNKFWARSVQDDIKQAASLTTQILQLQPELPVPSGDCPSC